MGNIENEWATEMVRRVGQQVRKLRGGLSAQWLSDETEALGRRVPVSVIAKLDSGHRGEVFQLSELLIIAAALGVSPAHLLFPDVPSGPVEVVPGVKIRSADAMKWFGGLEPDGRISDTESGVWRSGRLVREYEALRLAVEEAELRELTGDPTTVSSELLRERLARKVAELRQLDLPIDTDEVWR